MSIALLWMQSRDGTIGADGDLPWHIPEDQQRFKELTIGHHVLMGRKTYESLPQKVRPLPQRENIVVTRNENFKPAGVIVVYSLADGLAYGGQQPLWVIGGGEIYRQTISSATTLAVTEVDADSPGDTYAPVIDPQQFELFSDGPWQLSKTGLRYRYKQYRSLSLKDCSLSLKAI